MTYPTPPDRSRRSRRTALVVGGAAVALFLVAGGIGYAVSRPASSADAHRGDPSTSSATPSSTTPSSAKLESANPESTTAPPSSTPPMSPTPPPSTSAPASSSGGVSACPVAGLRLVVVAPAPKINGVTLALRNVSRTACSVGGYPGVELDTGGDGRAITTTVQRGGVPPSHIVLRPADQAVFSVWQQSAVACSQAKQVVGEVAIIPPDRTTQLSVRASFPAAVCGTAPFYVSALYNG